MPISFIVFGVVFISIICGSKFYLCKYKLAFLLCGSFFVLIGFLLGDIKVLNVNINAFHVCAILCFIFYAKGEFCIKSIIEVLVSAYICNFLLGYYDNFLLFYTPLLFVFSSILVYLFLCRNNSSCLFYYELFAVIFFILNSNYEYKQMQFVDVDLDIYFIMLFCLGIVSLLTFNLKKNKERLFYKKYEIKNY